MNTRVIKGAVLALFGALTVGFGHLLGLDLDQVALLGVTLGGVIGLVPDRTLGQRITGFAIGFVLAWVGYGLRAGMLPDTPAARALVVFGVIAIAMLIAAASGSRIPLWSCLVGAAAMVGAYEETYTASPSMFLDDSVTAATTVLLAVAMGVLGSALLGEDIVEQRAAEHADVEYVDDDVDSRHRSEVDA
jgi:hypothetical protein